MPSLPARHRPRPLPKGSAGLPADTGSGVRLPASGLWLLASLPLLLAGCVSLPPAPVIAYTGDPVVDGNAELAAAPPRDRVMWDDRIAAAALRRGQAAEARAKLDDALTTSAGILAGGDATEAAAARGLFHSEAEKPFVGEPYERIMAGFYRGILYWQDGEPDNARALFRSGELADSDTVDKTYAGDWVLLDYLDGLVTAKLGGDGGDALARARKNSGRPLPDYDPAANVLLFVEYGRGPRKIATGEYGEQLRFLTEPSQATFARLGVAGQTLDLPPLDDLNYQATTRGGRVMDHILGNKAVFKQTTDTVGDVALAGALVAAESGQRQKQRVVIGPDGRKHIVTTDETDRGSENAALALGVVGLLSKLASAATTPAADTRAWNNLPQYLSFGALRLAPGDYPATLTFFDAKNQPVPGRTQTFIITIPVPDPASAGPAGRPRDTVVFRSEVQD